MSYVLPLYFLTLFPLRDVRGGDVQFFFTQPNASEFWCAILVGPFGRTSGHHRFDGSVSQNHFYTAGDGIGSQYARWRFFFRDENSKEDADLLCTLAAANPVLEIGYDHLQEFDVSSTTTRVLIGAFPGAELSITQEGTATATRVDGTVFQHGTLGDDARATRPDRDIFSFDATEGDEITLRLVENPSTGHLGSQATLILRNAESGSPLNEEITEDVPIEMNLTIPATGKYEIIVEQHDIPPEVWFRGDYFLKLESSGDTEEILPGEHVEH
jgi:hypothetical protein